MSRKQENAAPQATHEMGFTVEIDGKVFGPFYEKQRKDYKYLENRKGVRFMPVVLPAQALSLSLSLSLVRGKSSTRSILRFLRELILYLFPEPAIQGFSSFAAASSTAS
jgi:hypothetical protein